MLSKSKQYSTCIYSTSNRMLYTAHTCRQRAMSTTIALEYPIARPTTFLKTPHHAIHVTIHK